MRRIRLNRGKNNEKELESIGELELEQSEEYFSEPAEEPDTEGIESNGFQLFDSSITEPEVETSTSEESEPFYTNIESQEPDFSSLEVFSSDVSEPVETSVEEPETPEFQVFGSAEAETELDMEVSTPAESEPFYARIEQPEPDFSSLDAFSSDLSEQVSADTEEEEVPEFQVFGSTESEAPVEFSSPVESEPLFVGLDSPDLAAISSDIDNPTDKPSFVKALTSLNYATLKRKASVFKVRLPKRPSNQLVVTVTSEKDLYRVVIFKRKRVLAWGSTPMKQDELPLAAPEVVAVEETSETDAFASLQPVVEMPLERLLGELGVRKPSGLWKTLGKVGVRRGRTVMDLSLYTTLMRHLQIPRVKGRYLEPVVVAEVLDSLPFTKEEVDISWQTQKDNENHYVFAVALPKTRLDAQVNAAKEAGLTPSAAYSKAAALALASGVPNGIVVHLEDDDTALVLVQNGDPKTVHQLELGQTDSDPEARTATITRAIEQVAAYFQPDGSHQGIQSLPVILTGKCGESNPVAQLLRSQLQRGVLSIQPSLTYAEDFPIEEYAINVGLYLTDQFGNVHASESPAAKSSSLNLLPDRHMPPPMPVFQAAVFVILMLLVVHPYNVVGRVDAQILENQAITQELQQLRAQEKEYDVVNTSYQESQAQIEDIDSKIGQLEFQLEFLEEQLDSRLAQLRVITGPALPSGIELSAVVPQGEDFAIQGTSRSHAETLRYVSNLRDTGLFDDARVQSVEGQGGSGPDASGNVNFQIRVFQIEDSDSEESEVDGEEEELE